MIVRDEAACLGECLQSLSPIVDRIVVCDTGSTDDTASITHSAGAEVIHRKWNHDFASARNEVLDTIADAVFILSIDADERVLCDDPDEFRRSLEALPATVDGLAIGVDNVRGDLPVSRSRAVRIFRPDRTRFRGALHETVKRLDGSDPTLLEVPDFPSAPPRLRPGPSRLCRKALAECPRSPRRQHSAATNPKTALDLARSLAAADQSPDEILSVVQSATEAMEAGDPYWVELLSLRAEFELTLDHLGAALATATQILAIAPSADVAGAVLAHAANRLGRDSDIVAAARAFDHESSVGTVVPHNRATLDAFAAAATIRSGETDAAIEFALRATAKPANPARCRPPPGVDVRRHRGHRGRGRAGGGRRRGDPPASRRSSRRARTSRCTGHQPSFQDQRTRNANDRHHAGAGRFRSPGSIHRHRRRPSSTAPRARCERRRVLRRPPPFTRPPPGDG